MPSRFERTTRLMLLSGSTCILALVATAAISAQGKTLAQSGVYTSAQAARGQAIYKERCATCHGAELQGAIAPPLVGDGFLTVWGGLLSELAAKVRNTMPADRSAKLTPAQAVDLVAYVLQAGKFPAGKTELTTDDAVLQTIGVVRHEPAGGPPFAPAGGKGTSFPPAGNLAAMMRGMLFPTSNLIFNVQTNRPGIPPPAKPQGAPRDGGFSWVDWGAGIYSGWDLVDYAAIAVAEAAPILLTPGRRCENGRPVPSTMPTGSSSRWTWRRRGVPHYRASQTRNQEAVSECDEPAFRLLPELSPRLPRSARRTGGAMYHWQIEVQRGSRGPLMNTTGAPNRPRGTAIPVAVILCGIATVTLTAAWNEAGQKPDSIPRPPTNSPAGMNAYHAAFLPRQRADPISPRRQYSRRGISGHPACRLASRRAQRSAQRRISRGVDWGQLPAGRKWGSTASVTTAPDGTIWVVDRCGNSGAGGHDVRRRERGRQRRSSSSTPSGKLLKTFGAGMFVSPHKLTVDKDGNLWVADNGSHQVFKLSQDGKVLMTLGKKGVAGPGLDEFDAPTEVAVAPTATSSSATATPAAALAVGNARIMKFDKNGKFLKTWGKKGMGPGEFDVVAHARARLARTGVRRRSSEQPHPDLRSGRQVHRAVVPVRPAERDVHRQEDRHALRGRLGVARRPDQHRPVRAAADRLRLQPGHPARHPDRQRPRRIGEGLHSRSVSVSVRRRLEPGRRRDGGCARGTCTARTF